MQDCQAQALNAAYDCSVNGLKTMLGLTMTYEACALICKSERRDLRLESCFSVHRKLRPLRRRRQGLR